MLYIHDLLDYKHYTFIKLYFVVVNYHSSCKCHLLLYGIHFIIICYELILNRLMLSLGIFLCMIFILYSLNTSNHIIKGTDYFLIIALVHFHMSFGFRIIQYFESLSQLSLRYICTDNILYKCLFMTVDIRHEICTVNILIYLFDIQDSLWCTLTCF